MKLLQSQKNTVFNLIESVQLLPSNFSWSNETTDHGDFASVLRYNNSDFFFRFETNVDKYHNETHFNHYSPGRLKYTETQLPESWIEQVNYFQKWLSYLKREISEPDKWERFESEIKNFSFSDDSGNEKFSVHEYEELAEKMNRLKEEIKTIHLLPEQLKVLDQKIDHLTQLAKDLGKTDWNSIFIGTIIGIVTQLSFTPENVTALVGIIKHIFTNLILQ